MPELLAATAFEIYWPFVVLVLSIAFIVVGIWRFRLHPFLALLIAGLLVGILADRPTWTVIAKGGEPLQLPHLVGAVELLAKGLGDTARDVAISIALAAIIGMALMESGAADKVVRRFLAFFGQKRAGWALLWSTYVLSIPLFFDTMFLLMVPLAKALRLRTGRDYLLYVLCICAGGAITHSMTVPHPGPIAAVETLRINVGFSILGGIIGGLVPAVIGYFTAVFLNRRQEIPLRETTGAALDDLARIVDKDERELPSFLASLVPVLLPIILITLSSGFKVLADAARDGAPWAVQARQFIGGPAAFDEVRQYVDFIGHKNIALLIGAFSSLWLLARQRRHGLVTLEKLVAGPLETAGMIILITSAGGAFGLMLRSAGVGDAVKAVALGEGGAAPAVSLVLLAYAVTFVIRVAQGSATVAMLTGASIILPLIEGADLPYHPLYLYLAIGWGSMAASWMNDSGFWVVSRLGGLTERETLKSWTVLLTVISLSGFIVTWLLSKILPLNS